MVAREITLLPRHWDWLAAQPGGASVALRKLVEEARHNPRLRLRAARDSLYRFMTALVGNAPGYEEAIRALYAGERDEFFAHIEAWPGDVRAKLEDAGRARFRLEVRDQPFFLPIAIAGGLGAFGTAAFRRQGDAAVPGRGGPRLRLGALARFLDAGGDCFGLKSFSFAIMLDLPMRQLTSILSFARSAR